MEGVGWLEGRRYNFQTLSTALSFRGFVEEQGLNLLEMKNGLAQESNAREIKIQLFWIGLDSMFNRLSCG